MSEEKTTPDPLNEALAALIDKTIDGADTAINFLSAELPEVIEQLLMWHFSKNLFLATVFIGAAWFFWGKVTAYLGDGEHHGSDEEFFLTFFKWVLSGIFIACGILIFLVDALFIFIAPKVYLLEYMRGLL